MCIRDRYILVFKDSLTRYVELCAIPSRSGIHIANALLHRVIVRHTTPSIIFSDQSCDFVQSFFKQLCKLWKVKNVGITVLPSTSNSLIDRAKVQIENYLRRYVNKKGNDWSNFLPFAQLCINSSYNETIGDSPHFILFGYSKRLPYDVENYVTLFTNPDKNYCPTHEELKDIVIRTNLIREIAKENLEAETRKFVE